MTEGRALRRHHQQRMKVKAKRKYPSDPRATHYADNLALCSCVLCGNPRRFAKGAQRLTVQERRIIEDIVAGEDDGTGATARLQWSLAHEEVYPF